MWTRTRWLTMGTVTMALFCRFAIAQATLNTATIPLKSILESMEKARAGVGPQVAYQIIREYSLFGAKESTSNSYVVAAVDFKPPARKDYKIQASSGSTRGQQVVRRILDYEVAAASTQDQERTALNTDNYDFIYVGETMLDGQPCYVLGLKPKRKESDLIAGKAWVDKSFFLVRQIEGDVAKTPSWWLRNVRVKLLFADFRGTWLQTRTEAVADVRMMGTHTLTSRVLDYRGSDEVASTTHSLSPKP